MSGHRPVDLRKSFWIVARGRIYAVDVGTDQLRRSLRARLEIVSLENTRHPNISRDQLGASPDLVSVNVSFLSLKLALPSALELAGLRPNL